jgi:hypothetical protein
LPDKGIHALFRERRENARKRLGASACPERRPNLWCPAVLFVSLSAAILAALFGVPFGALIA